MIEFRCVVWLTLWTLLIGPVVDFTQRAPTAQKPHAGKRAEPCKLPG